MAEAMSYNDIGRMLQNAREDLRLDIREAARLLHIRQRYLEALEEGTPNDLPGGAYARGYLMQYARFLGFNPEEAASAFDKAGVFPPRRLLHIPQHFSKSQRPSAVLIAVCTGAFIGIAISWHMAQGHALIPLSPVRPLPVEKVAREHPPAACEVENRETYPPCYWGKRSAFFILPEQWKDRSITALWSKRKKP